ncbi:hypothetical protein VYU27_006132 [Nannochloropsis oceanica]
MMPTPPSHRRHPLPSVLLLFVLLLPLLATAFFLPAAQRIPATSSSSAFPTVLHASSSSKPPKPSPSELSNTVPPPPPSSSPSTATTSATDDIASKDGTDATADEVQTTPVPGLSPTMYDKLRSEATTPFRSLRMFIYGGFGVGAGLGGYTAVTQLIQSLQHRPDALPLSQTIVNVGVDFGVLAAATAAWVFENRIKKVSEKEMQELRAKEPFRLTFDMKQARERALSALPLTFQVGVNETRTASVKELREKGGQHLIVLAAPKAALADALFGARVGKTLFAKNNVMIAPFEVEGEGTGSAGGEVKGFGAGGGKAMGMKEALLDAEAYVAKPAEMATWNAYIEEEFSDAFKQGNEDARKRGIGIVMRKDGSIIRRGLGQPEWREVVAELTGAKGTTEFGDAYVPPIIATGGAGGRKGGKKKKKKA